MKNSQFDNKLIPAKYIQRYFHLNSSAEMQAMNLFPNIKEITESFGIFNAIENYLIPTFNLDRKINNTICFVVGDGSTPRTASVINFMTKWTIVSIDPRLNYAKWESTWSKIQRLNIFKGKGEDYKIDKNSLPYLYTNAIIILPHSHIDRKGVNYFWNQCDCFKNLFLINLPCCFPGQDEDLRQCLVHEYTDDAINSFHCKIKIYKK